MKLYLVTQEENQDYDSYDAIVVAAESEAEARQINPAGEWGKRFSSWCETPDKVTVQLIGVAVGDIEPGIVLGSFNAG